MIGNALTAIGVPLLRRLDPETAHRLSLHALALGIAPSPPPSDPARAVEMMGLRFPNRLGLAAGYDKDAQAVETLARIGFGHIEIGTVTPHPQPGNPRPRAFRLPEDGAVINRYGFNNSGHEAVHGRLLRARERGLRAVLGVNVGANKDADDRAADYASGVRRFLDLADYLTVNVSSPNTPGLRELQGAEALRRLLGMVGEARSGGPHRPILLKIAPDLDEAGLDDILKETERAGIDGLIVSNTTISRDGLRSPNAKEAGGVSGRPLMAPSTAMLARVRERVGPNMALIGAGGVFSTADARAKIAAGADLVQLYTGLTYRGPGLVREIVEGMG